MEPCRLDAVDALRQRRGGRLSATRLVRSCLERIAEREPVVRAFAHLDPPAALRQAATVDAQGPGDDLCGLPVGVKDIIDTADMPTAYGSALHAGHRPARDADCVARLRAARAILPGKTATTEFAGAQPAPTRHPLRPTATPGGSSAGSAAAVADCMLPVAIGTQTAGSVIRPQGCESGLTRFSAEDVLHVGAVPTGHFAAELEAWEPWYAAGFGASLER